MLVLEWILMFFVIISSILGILLILLQGSQNARGLFEDSGNNLFSNVQGNWITRLTGTLVAVFLISSLAYAYIQSLSYKTTEKEAPDFIKKETLNHLELNPSKDASEKLNKSESESQGEEKSFIKKIEKPLQDDVTTK